MNAQRKLNLSDDRGSAMVCALTTILILSLVGAGVLMNITTRYNASSTQVKGWKEALVAAESGGEMGFRVLRENVADPANAFNSASGWVSPAPAPLSGANSWAIGFEDANPIVFGPENRLRTMVTVDRFQLLPGTINETGYYRIRAIGTAQVTGLKRVGMDNRMNILTEGDNLLRKIDFNFRHFKAAYGHGDALPTAAATTANGKAITAVSNPNKPEVSRRIELIATPIMPIEGAVKTAGRLRASGATFDSYDSKNGPHPGGTPAPNDVDAYDADMVCGSSDFSASFIYGDIATNGGAARTNQATGVVDNNVVSIMPPAVPGVAPLKDVILPPSFPEPTPNPAVLSPSATPYPAGHANSGKYPTEFWYSYANLNGVTVNPLKAEVRGVANTPIDTTVNIYVTGDVRSVHIAKGVTLKVYFRGNMNGAARDFHNFNVDGPGGHGVYAPNFVDRGEGSVPRYTLGLEVAGAARTSGSRTVTSATAVFGPEDVGKSIEGAGIPTNAIISSVTNANTVVISTNATATTTTGNVTVGAYVPSPLVSRANHMWFYGISPTDGTARSIDISPPGDDDSFYAGIYAPSHDFTTRGNPDFYGCFVVKSFYTNGNNEFHYDKQLAAGTDPLDYRLSSYIEDIR